MLSDEDMARFAKHTEHFGISVARDVSALCAWTEMIKAAINASKVENLMVDRCVQRLANSEGMK
jgi:hypothetical protein